MGSTLLQLVLLRQLARSCQTCRDLKTAMSASVLRSSSTLAMLQAMRSAGCSARPRIRQAALMRTIHSRRNSRLRTRRSRKA